MVLSVLVVLPLTLSSMIVNAAVDHTSRFVELSLFFYSVFPFPLFSSLLVFQYHPHKKLQIERRCRRCHYRRRCYVVVVVLTVAGHRRVCCCTCAFLGGNGAAKIH